MNQFQEQWWLQAKSDLEVLLVLRRQDAAPCHQLHYLQMVTEKIGKAYFWRASKPPPKSHAVFVQFMRALASVQKSKRLEIAEVFSFGRFEDFQNWWRAVSPLAYDVERLAPSLALNGPNTEYPWPPDAPARHPAGHEFEVWKQLKETGQGRQLMQVIETAVKRFPDFA